MAALGSDSEDMIVGINITPMVDVMLVLLVIFMMAAPALYNRSIQVDLPSAKSAQNSEKVTLKFTLKKDGTLFMNETHIQSIDLPQLLKTALLKDPKVNAVVEADRSLTHGAVIELIDQLKLAGIQRFAIAVGQSQSPQ